jgi:hypothetical protein
MGWFRVPSVNGTNFQAVVRLLAIFACAFSLVAPASAQTQVPKEEKLAPSDCPPGAGSNPPTLSGKRSGDLSKDLAQSNGVICPPGHVDPEIRIMPPAGGRTPEIKPKDLPNGDNKEPK